MLIRDIYIVIYFHQLMTIQVRFNRNRTLVIFDALIY